VLTGLDSAREKLIRAAIHIKAVEGAIAEYSATEPHETIGDANSETIARITKQPPISISILAGDALYQIRSALDHLAFELVQRNPAVSTIDSDWREHCEFPLRSRISKNHAPPLPQSQFSRCLPGIPATMFAFIEGLQPYNHNATAFHLRVLAELSNIDKHRYLNLVRARLSHKQTFRTASSSLYSSVQAVDDGAPIPPLPTFDTEGTTPVDVERSLCAFVTFGEPTIGGATTLPVEDVLQACLHIAETIILPTFEEFFDNC
jgi:hypothetical protein